jgi:hypothetical protein
LDLKLVSRSLGEDLVAGCPVQPSPQHAVAAVVGGEVASEARTPLDGYAGPCYLALGRATVALFAYKPGAFAFAPGERLAAHHISDIAWCEFWPARTGLSRLFLSTKSGVAYDLWFAPAHRGTAHRIAEAIDLHLRSNAA